MAEALAACASRMDTAACGSRSLEGAPCWSNCVLLCSHGVAVSFTVVLYALSSAVGVQQCVATNPSGQCYACVH